MNKLLLLREHPETGQQDRGLHHLFHVALSACSTLWMIQTKALSCEAPPPPLPHHHTFFSQTWLICPKQIANQNRHRHLSHHVFSETITYYTNQVWPTQICWLSYQKIVVLRSLGVQANKLYWMCNTRFHAKTLKLNMSGVTKTDALVNPKEEPQEWRISFRDGFRVEGWVGESLCLQGKGEGGRSDPHINEREWVIL